MQLTDYFAMIKERLALVALLIVATTAAAVAVFGMQAPIYESAVRVRAVPPAPFSASNEVFQQEQTDLGTEAELVRSTTVASQVIARLSLDQEEPNELLDQITTGVTPNTAVIVVLASASEPDEAVALSNAFAEEYLEHRRQALTATIETQIERIEAELAESLARLAQVDALVAEADAGSTGAVATGLEREQVLAEIVSSRQALSVLADRQAIQQGFGQIIQPAVEARSVRSTSLPRAGVFGVLIGLPLSLAVVLLLDSLNRSVRSQIDAERATGSQALGLIPVDEQWTDPRDPRLAARAAPLSAVAQSYRTLAHNLTRAAASMGARSIVFTSPGDGDGKTSVLANTAIALAESGRLATLVDADLRNPRLHLFLGAPGAPGVVELLADRRGVREALQQVEPRLKLIPSGRATERPDALIARAWNDELLEKLSREVVPDRPIRVLRTSADEESPAIARPILLIDSPPVLTASDASIVAAAADAVVLVVRAGLTARQDVAAAARQLRQAGGSLVGVVVIGGRSSEDPLLEPRRLPTAHSHPPDLSPASHASP